MQTVSLEFKGTHEADGALDDVVILYRLRMLVFEPSIVKMCWASPPLTWMEVCLEQFSVA